MEENEAWPLPGGLHLNGLLLNQTCDLKRAADAEIWAKVEETIADLIDCIQPNQASEERRNAVAKYVQNLIMKCFSCEVFTFGSVPLKTYLPDGDIDLTAFNTSEDLKDTWANAVLKVLENEGKSGDGEFRVKEVHYIRAEVKIIKCLVENIVVDISFSQVGGLCTLCFLEEIDHLIGQNHLFKRSIILIKAWCYYESRILGAYHGLISTYTLEILILYIFHVFNNTFTGPFEVLYRFLEFFSNFDWDNFCVSILGPVPISSLPDMTAELPRKDGGKLLFDNLFLEACSTIYAASLGGQENQGQQFVSKHLNVIDPLRINNNLGRSVSKGNFYRIRSAFAFGAKKLANLLDYPKENLVVEINRFFINTWERLRSSNQPDAPLSSFRYLQPLVNFPNEGSNNSSVATSLNKMNGSIGPQVSHEHQAGGGRASRGYASHVLNTITKQAQPTYMTTNAVHVNSRDATNLERNATSCISIQSENNQKNSRPDHSVSNNEGENRFQISMMQASPELAGTFTDSLSQIKHDRIVETSKTHNEHLISEHSNTREIMDAEVPSVQSARFSLDDPKSLQQSSSHQSVEVATDSSVISNSYLDDSGSTAMGAAPASDSESLELQQKKEQDLVNMMASSGSHDFIGQVIQGFDPSFLPYHCTNATQNSSSEEADPVNDNSSKTSPEEGKNDSWHDHDAGSMGGFETENEGLQMHSDERQNFNANRYKHIPTSRGNVSSTSVMQGNHKVAAESRGQRDDYPDSFQHQTGRANDVSATDRNANLRFVPKTQSSSCRKSSSDTSRNALNSRVTKTARDKYGRKQSLSEVTTSLSGKPRSGWQFEGAKEHISSSRIDDENPDSVPLFSAADTSLKDHILESLPLASTNVRNQLSRYEDAPISATDTSTSIEPVVVGNSRQEVVDNSSVPPFAYYPSGPLVPFLTMLPPYNFLAGEANYVSSAEQFNEDSGEQSFRSPSHQDIDDIMEKYYQSEGHMNPVDFTRADALESSKALEMDILNSDFASHWQNLQYGRLCQNTPNHGPLVYSPPFIAQPVYLQHYPLDGPVRPPTASFNFLTPVMGYDPRLVPVASLQPGPSRSSSGYDRYEDEQPSFWAGTGTYIPNPKPSFRDQHTSSKRNHRGSYNYERSDRKDREGSWINSKAQSGSLPSHMNTAGREDDQRPPADANSTRRTRDHPRGGYRGGSAHSSSSHEKPSSPPANANSTTRTGDHRHGGYRRGTAHSSSQEKPSSPPADANPTRRTRDHRHGAYRGGSAHSSSSHEKPSSTPNKR